MNAYAVIILIALAGEFALDLVAGALNLRRLRPDLPPEFLGVFDADRYRKSQEYARVNTGFGWIHSGFDLLLILAFWFAGGFQALDGWVRSWTAHPVWAGLAFIGLLAFAKTLLTLPFSAVDTFAVERRFGFNRTTPATFFLDLVKGLFLAVVLGGPLLAGLLAFFEAAGPWAWLFCWAAVACFSLFVQTLAPTVILPLFNRFTPLEDGELKDRILSYTGSVRYPVKGVFVMDGSKRSTKSNAFFTGFGRNRRIALYDTLIAQHTPVELVSVLAHEIGHFKRKHIPKTTALGIAHTGVVFFLLSRFVQEPGLFEAFGMRHASVYAGFLFFGLLYSPVRLALSVAGNALSRSHEFQADRFAVETTGNPEALSEALKKLAVHNLSNLTPHPFLVFLYHSHPPVLERIRRIHSPRTLNKPRSAAAHPVRLPAYPPFEGDSTVSERSEKWI